MATNKGKTGTKNTQTSGYTPSKSVIKVVDPRTGKPYMYDKQYDAIFDTNGNQLDSDDFRHIRELTKITPKKDYATLVAEKKKELREKGITSEYAAYYRPGESEKALSIIDYSTDYKTMTTPGVTEKLAVYAGENAKKQSKNYFKSKQAIKITDNPLLWSLGLPMQGGYPGNTNYGYWDISDYRPTRGSEEFPYYFTPLGNSYKDSEDKRIREASLSNFIHAAIDDYRYDPEKYKNSSMEMYDAYGMGHLGTFGASIAPDSSYLSIHDKWDLDPNAVEHMPTFAPDFVYSAGLTKLGIPKKDHAKYIKGFREGKSVTEITGFAPTVPVYDRIYKDPVSGKNIKDILKEDQDMTKEYAYGGKVKKYANGGKLPIDMYGRLVKKYEDGGRTPINVAPIESLPAGIIQDLEYQKYVDRINSNGIAKVAQSPGLLSTKSSNATGDVVGAIGNIAGGFLSSSGTKQVEKGRIVGGTAMQAAGAVAPIATNPALLAATGGLSALAIPLAAGIGALAGIPKQKKYNRIEDADNIEEGMAMYQGLNQQNNYMQDPIRYAAYGGKINHYGDGGESYDPTTDPNLMKEVVITAARKNVVADMFAGIIENMNTSGKAKNRKNDLEVMKTLTAYLQNPMQTSNFLNMSTGTAPTFYGYNNVAQFPGTYMPKAAYGGQQGELAQLEQLNGVKENYVDKYGRTKTTNATESHKSMEMKGKTNTPTDYLQNGDNIFSAKSYSKDELKTILDAHKTLTGENVKLGLDVLTPYYNTKNKTKISPADINKVVAKKFNPKNLTNNSFNTAAINARNQTYANLATTKFNEALNPATFQGIAQQGNQQIEQILRAAYGGKMKKYAYGGDPEDEPGYRSGNSSWAGAPGAGLRDAQYPSAMLSPSVRVDIPKPPIPDYSGERNQFPHYYDGTSYERDKQFEQNRQEAAGPMYRGYNRGNGIDYPGTTYQPPAPLQNGTGLPASAYVPPTAGTPATPDMVMPPYFNSEARDVPYPRVPGNPQQEYTPADAAIGWASRQGYYDPSTSTYTAEGKGFAENFIKSMMGTKQDSSDTTNKKSPYKLSPADIAALGVGGANAMASLLTLQQKMYDNEITDKSNIYNMKTELPDNFTNPTLGALRAGLQSTNNWKNTSAMSSEMLSKTVTGLNSALLEQSRQNVGLFNAKQAAIYQALGIDTANKLAWNKDKTALGNYKLSAIGENLLKMASSGNTRAAENALAQMDDATLRAMLVTIGPNSKYFTEQIERIINSRKGK